VRRSILLVLLLLLLSGCAYGGLSGSSSSGGGPATSDETQAKSNVRAAIPAIETYYAENSTYVGLTLPRLNALDPAIVNNVSLIRSTDKGYCVESEVGTAVYRKNGPAAKVVKGSCG
jgi:hypothetical protein